MDGSGHGAATCPGVPGDRWVAGSGPNLQDLTPAAPSLPLPQVLYVVYCFFCLIVLSSYTANLTSFLSVKRADQGISGLQVRRVASRDG